MHITTLSGRPFRRFAGTAMIAATFTLLASPAATQGSLPIVLLLDQDAIAPAKAPNSFSPTAVNATIGAVGVRDFLPVFNGRAGQAMVLPSGRVGYEGWFALKAVPINWESASGLRDGLQNFLLAGAGLGSPDRTGNRLSLLVGLSTVAPLRATALPMLIGQRVCAVVFAGDIPWTATSTSLRGANLGVVAFTVSGVVGGDSTTLPSVQIQLLDPGSTCSGPVAAFVETATHPPAQPF
jgi:hypothetical protein